MISSKKYITCSDGHKEKLVVLEPGEGQPMLWVPDQVVGALGAVEAGGAAGAAASEWSADWRRIERDLIAYTVTP